MTVDDRFVTPSLGRIVLAAAAVAVFSACASSANPTREPHEVWKRPGGGFLADAQGRFYGDAERDCAWFGGRNGGPVIVFPARYRVRFHPLRVVVAATGRVVAREGDWIRTVGGGTSSGVPGCPMATGFWRPTTLEFWGRTRPKHG